MRNYKIQSKQNGFFLHFYTTYFPYDEQSGNRSSKSNDFQYNVLL